MAQRELVAYPPRWEETEVVVGFRLGRPEHHVRYRVRGSELAPTGDFLIPLLLPIAMRSRARLRLPDGISPRLLASVPDIQNVFHSWNRRFRHIEVEADAVEASRPDDGAGSASFFSGGVDSFYNALTSGSELTHLIFVHGLDIPLANVRVRAAASRAVREAADELGKECIEVETDLRSTSDSFVDWQRHYHGAGMAQVGLLLQQPFGRVLIPGTHTPRHLHPLGSHPHLDPLWSTELTTFEHTAGTVSGPEKIAYLADFPVAMRHLRVCFENPTLRTISGAARSASARWSGCGLREHSGVARHSPTTWTSRLSRPPYPMTWTTQRLRRCS